MRAPLPLIVALSLLSACAAPSRQLRNPQTGETATCSYGLVIGDPVVKPDNSYCRCLTDRLGQGFIFADKPTLAMCPVEFSN
jgi:hypothetical protein